MIIIGAGMAGLLAGIINPGAAIFEAAKAAPDNHKAVLRFREDKISKVTGIPFRKIKVWKSIWCDGHTQLTPMMMNWYSRKVTGRIVNRSITSLEPVERYVAPNDFHLQMAELCHNRIHYDSPITELDKNKMVVGGTLERNDHPVLSTMPMPILCKLLHIYCTENFSFKPIQVVRYAVFDADTFQTIYYPDPSIPIYRATLTGDSLIVEAVDVPQQKISYMDMQQVLASFGLTDPDVELISESHQQYGKIAPIDESVRKHIMLEATMKHNVFSLGRFACWRNILLDDVYEDIFKIKRMIGQHHYDLKLEAVK